MKVCVCVLKRNKKSSSFSCLYKNENNSWARTRAYIAHFLPGESEIVFLRKLKNNRWLLSWCVVCLCLCINKSSINLKLSYESNSWRAALMPFRGDNFKLFTECFFFAYVFLLLLLHIYDSFVNLFDQCVCVEFLLFNSLTLLHLVNLSSYSSSSCLKYAFFLLVWSGNCCVSV